MSINWFMVKQYGIPLHGTLLKKKVLTYTASWMNLKTYDAK